MFKKMLRKFLEIDELENQLTQIDKELQDNIEETACHRTDLDDRPNFYDMESQVEELVNNEMADVIKRLETLEDK